MLHAVPQEWSIVDFCDFGSAAHRKRAVKTWPCRPTCFPYIVPLRGARVGCDVVGTASSKQATKLYGCFEVAPTVYGRSRPCFVTRKSKIRCTSKDGRVIHVWCTRPARISELASMLTFTAKEGDFLSRERGARAILDNCVPPMWAYVTIAAQPHLHERRMIWDFFCGGGGFSAGACRHASSCFLVAIDRDPVRAIGPLLSLPTLQRMVRICERVVHAESPSVDVYGVAMSLGRDAPEVTAQKIIARVRARWPKLDLQQLDHHHHFSTPCHAFSTATPKTHRTMLKPAAVRLITWTHKFHKELSRLVGHTSGSMEQVPGVKYAT